MATEFEIAEARPADAETIASLFALSWNSPFTRLQWGQIEPFAMTPRIAARMAKEGSKFLVARSRGTGEIVAVAQWSMPANVENENVELEEDRKERQQFEDEVYMRNLPENSNKDLIMTFTLGLRQLREETLQGRRHFLLENLATHPDHRGKGLASQLVEWVFPFADEQQAVVYLDTASDNPAARLYRRLGFEEQGRNSIKDLSRFASLDTIRELDCEIDHTHVAFLRFPAVHKQATV
jgi:ribosomal protein S18 acetylase RimI-like enzyme